MFGLFKGQQSYTVHEQPDPPADRDERAEKLKFVRDGFSLFAFILPPVWMLANRLWLVLVGYLIILGLVYLTLDGLGIATHWNRYAVMALNLIIAFEADSLIRWTLERRGWRLVGSVSGDNFDVCERRFFEQWVKEVGVISAANLDRPGQFGGGERQSPPEPKTGDVMPPKRTAWQSAGRWTSWKRA